MKRSERLIRNTILVLAGLVVLHVGVSRLYADSNAGHAVQRTSEADLAKLRDFSAIEVNGNLSVDVVQGAGYSVALQPADASQGDIVATVHDRTLILRGFNNTPASGVRVALPTLTQIDVHGAPALSLSGFCGGGLSLRLAETPQVTLRNNCIRQWHIVASEAAELRIDKASMSAGKVDVAGHIKLTVID
ncbi:MAG: GIN domain-containing protein [Steroidobacteraceae bacterium]